MKAILPTRRLIPKWRSVRRTLATQEAAPTPTSVSPPAAQRSSGAGAHPAAEPPPEELPVDLDEFEQAVALWNEHQEPGILGDILSFSIHSTLERRIIEIGTKAIRGGAPVTPAQRFVIRHLAHTNGDSEDLQLLEPGAPGKAQTQPFAESIRKLRALLRTDPSNALALLDFAQLQAAIGRNDVAERALRTALGEAPNSRLVLRSLARFYVHAGENEQAHLLVRRHERTPFDPWLMASEIALADLVGIPSAFLAKGRRVLVEAGKTPPSNFTELAGSLAMAELGAGNLKKARELQRLALLDPTDNVAAQAVDRELQFGIALNTPNIMRAIASSAEAQLLQSWFGLMPEAVEQHAINWHSEEPFSSRPIQLLTALYAYRGQLEKAQRWLLGGLRSDAEDRGLLINLAFVQARSGDTEQARLTMLKTRRLYGDEVEPYMCATEGLIAYRHGKFEEGDQLYAQAAELFDAPAKRRYNASTFCLLNQAIMALTFQHPRVAEIVARTNDALAKRPNPDATMLLKVTASAELTEAPAREQENHQRLTSQWVFDPKRNSLTERKGLTAPGASPIVLLNDPRKKG